ncbi:tail fiber protein [Paenibacillus sp. KS-LC4]|uniref:phage tail protein n=1 Tax=Paenibacillus sp. KS-LC4 TaxID=2979727 RepID=UPI0030D2646C
MDAFLGEIRLFTGNYAPKGWAFCHGQQLSIWKYQALYSLLQGAFGSDYKTYFTLPDLRGLVPIHQGVGTGLTPRALYAKGGSSTEKISEMQMPNHTHVLNAQTAANTMDAVNSIWANQPRGTTTYAYGETPDANMNPLALQASGGSQAHNNMQPFVAINYIICLEEGIYPVKD